MNSVLAEVIEVSGRTWKLFAAFDDAGAQKRLNRARADGHSVSAACTLEDAAQSGWRRLFGELVMPEGPMSESY